MTKCSIVVALSIGWAFGQTAPVFEPVFPPPSNEYPPGPDSQPHPEVPAGKTFTFEISNPKTFPGTIRTITVYVPAAYRPEKPACVYVGLDGLGFRVPQVFDNLIEQKSMPVTIAVGVAPGRVDSASASAGENPRWDRSFEFDSLTGRFSHFVIDEVLPAVEQRTTPAGDRIVLSRDPNNRAIGGGSTGAIGAFTVAWERPDAFRRVFSSIGTYVGMRGGERYNVLVRKTEPKPIRIFMQDGVHDEWPGGPEMGDWWMSNQTMERALDFAGYDVRHIWGAGTHNGSQATAVFPEAMRWLWRDWPSPIRARTPGNPALTAVLEPGQDWQVETGGAAPPAQKQVAVRDGDRYLTSPEGGLWLVRSNGAKVQLAKGLKDPSGLALSPDGLWLFVAQRASRWGLSYRVRQDGAVDAGEPLYDFVVPNSADDSGAESVWMDRDGRAYVATRVGVQIFDRNGRVIAILPLPGNEPARDLWFGGADLRTLYVVSGGKIYRRRLRSVGFTPGSPRITLPKWGAG
jgi:enterochelin esterase-like enzyme